jgi:hypothetical protein
VAYPETPPPSVDPDAYRRLTEDGFEVFPVTADGILRWALLTDPPPSRDAVVSHVADLRRRGILSDADLAALAHPYPELADLP